MTIAIAIPHDHHRDTLMQTLDSALDTSRHIHRQFERLLQISSSDDLARCARLLGLYLAIYKHEFGEIPSTTIEGFLDTEARDDMDPLITEIFNTGLREVSSLLSLIQAGNGHAETLN